mmetsp:Transcript_19957/g.76547  ORF Transcript_19957/g.76547 Transcript_19957/m.76547 type:complete len:209 (-) Transcript_19957:144-770(-)
MPPLRQPSLQGGDAAGARDGAAHQRSLGGGRGRLCAAAHGPGPVCAGRAPRAHGERLGRNGAARHRAGSGGDGPAPAQRAGEAGGGGLPLPPAASPGALPLYRPPSGFPWLLGRPRHPQARAVGHSQVRDRGGARPDGGGHHGHSEGQPGSLLQAGDQPRLGRWPAHPALGEVLGCGDHGGAEHPCLPPGRSLPAPNLHRPGIRGGRA